MPTEDAYSSGHLVLSHFGTCICSNVETKLSWTCLVSGLFELRTSLGTSVLLLRDAESPFLPCSNIRNSPISDLLYRVNAEIPILPCSNTGNSQISDLLYIVNAKIPILPCSNTGKSPISDLLYIVNAKIPILPCSNTGKSPISDLLYIVNAKIPILPCSNTGKSPISDLLYIVNAKIPILPCSNTGKSPISDLLYIVNAKIPILPCSDIGYSPIIRSSRGVLAVYPNPDKVGMDVVVKPRVCCCYILQFTMVTDPLGAANMVSVKDRSRSPDGINHTPVVKVLWLITVQVCPRPNHHRKQVTAEFGASRCRMYT